MFNSIINDLVWMKERADNACKIASNGESAIDLANNLGLDHKNTLIQTTPLHPTIEEAVEQANVDPDLFEYRAAITVVAYVKGVE